MLPLIMFIHSFAYKLVPILAVFIFMFLCMRLLISRHLYIPVEFKQVTAGRDSRVSHILTGQSCYHSPLLFPVCTAGVCPLRCIAATV